MGHDADRPYRGRRISWADFTKLLGRNPQAANHNLPFMQENVLIALLNEASFISRSGCTNGKHMSHKPPPTGKYFTISPKGDRKAGTFVERSSGDGKFVVRTMDGRVFDGARSAANTVLRQEAGKFLPTRPGTKK